MLGASISVSLALVIHSVYQRVSWHSLGMGGLVAIALHAAQTIARTDMSLGLAAIILAAGLTGTARLWLGKHTPYEVGRGYLFGFLCMTIALFI